MTEQIGWRRARDMTHEAKTAELCSRLRSKWNTRAALAQQPEPAQQDEPAQEHGPVAAAFSAAFGAEQRPTDERVVIERRGETLYLNGQEIGPGTLDIRRDGATYRAAERVAVQPEPLSDREIDALFHDWNSHCYGDPVKSHRRFARAVERKVRGEKE
jgi:hypothetical protein